MRKRTRIIGIVVILLAVGVLGAWATRRPVQALEANGAGVTTVAVVQAKRQDMARNITVTAELVPFQEVEIMAKIAGYVQKMLVDVGDRVQPGQMLAVLEIPEMRDDLARSAAAIRRNRADVARAQDELRRAESSYQMMHLTYTRLAGVEKTRPGLVAQQEIDDAQSRDLMAAAQVAAAKSGLAMAEEQIRVSQAEENKLKTLLEYTRVTAPFAGVITKRYADTGAMIQSGTASHSQAMPVVRLSQNNLLRLVLPVPESAAGLVRVGAVLEVRIPTLGRTIAGRVARTNERVETSTRTLGVQVDVPNPGGELIPGMYAEVNLTLASSPNALTVPVGALHDKDGTRSVYVVGEGGKLAARQVSTGLESATAAQITSGLSEGEVVVISNTSQLTPGQTVETKLTGGAG
jgi:RND family efflux transporter MFP subunit